MTAPNKLYWELHLASLVALREHDASKLSWFWSRNAKKLSQVPTAFPEKQEIKQAA